MCLSHCIFTDSYYMTPYFVTQQCSENMKFHYLNTYYCIMYNSHQGNEGHRKSQNQKITLKLSELNSMPVST
jgi:hypothetical protein